MTGAVATTELEQWLQLLRRKQKPEIKQQDRPVCLLERLEKVGKPNHGSLQCSSCLAQGPLQSIEGSEIEG